MSYDDLPPECTGNLSCECEYCVAAREKAESMERHGVIVHASIEHPTINPTMLVGDVAILASVENGKVVGIYVETDGYQPTTFKRGEHFATEVIEYE